MKADKEDRPSKIIIDMDRANRYDYSHPNYDEFAKRCIVDNQILHKSTKIFRSECELKLFYMDKLMERNKLNK